MARERAAWALWILLTAALVAQPPPSPPPAPSPALGEAARAALRDLRRADAAQRAALETEVRAWVAREGKEPRDYVLERCTRHRIVLLGETHLVRENLRFVLSLLPGLQERDTTLVSEFFRARQNREIEALLAADTFDREGALALLRDLPWPTWGFRSYLDLLEQAWRLRREHRDRPPIRIVGMDSDWTQHQMWFDGLSQRERFDLRLKRERTMAATVRAELARGRRVLVWCGVGHSVTRHGIRLGTVLRQDFGDELHQVVLHHGLEGISPFLETVLAPPAEPGPFAPTGRAIAVLGGPLEQLRSSGCRALRMIGGRAGPAPFAHYAESWVFLVPLARQSKPVWITGFVTPERYEETRRIVERMSRSPLPEGIDDAASLDAWMRQRYPAAPGPGRKPAREPQRRARAPLSGGSPR